jgi:hypothetical protein
LTGEDVVNNNFQKEINITHNEILEKGDSGLLSLLLDRDDDYDDDCPQLHTRAKGCKRPAGLTDDLDVDQRQSEKWETRKELLLVNAAGDIKQ